MLTSDLYKIREKVWRRTSVIEDRFLALAHSKNDPHLTHLILELDNLYIESLRAFTLASMGGARCRSGQSTNPTTRFMDQGQAAAFILQTLNPTAFAKLGAPGTVNRKKEPSIRNLADVEKVLSRLGTTNVPSVRTAAAYPSTFVDLLPTFRNFFAHRNQDTTRKVKTKIRSLGVVASEHPANLLFAMIPTRPVRVCEDWFLEMRDLFDALTW